jgi:four helix bundle suffix protein
MELKLTNVARASLEELRLDYEDFLRQRGLPQWPRSLRTATNPIARRAELIARRPATADAVAAWVAEIHGQNGRRGQGKSGQKSIQSTESTQPTYPEIAANGALALIMVASSLLNRQVAAQAAAFEKEGGFTERLYRVRKTKG